jgi:hypothetical protein
VIAFYSNTAAKKDMPAFEVSNDGLIGRFLASEIDGLKRECRKRAPDELEAMIAHAADT